MTIKVKIVHKDGTASDGEVPGQLKPPRFVAFEGRQYELGSWVGDQRTPQYREVDAKHEVVLTDSGSAE